MRFRTEVVREGENMGPIDWTYGFIGHFSTYCSTPEYKQERCDHAVAVLRRVVEHGDPRALQIRCGDYWYDVLDVGMYDGWPYWRPTPAVMVRDRVLGGAIWKFFYDLDDARAQSKP